ncbi:MAG: ABC transporter permease [Anaerolineae bacterium]|nr:ABC transporter permease [Anaerolineae bacterium]
MNTVRAFFIELGKTLKLLSRNRVAFFGLIVLVFLFLMSYIGPLIWPAETKANLAEIYQGPSLKHPLGTDFQGQDNLLQIIHGGRVILEIAFITGILTTLIAVTIGSLSAFIGGAFDSVMVELINVWLTIPQFPLLAILATMLKVSDVWLLAIILALLDWPGLARQVRAQVLSLKKRDYIEAAITLDLGTPHIIFREILPNMMSYIAISLIFATTGAIYQQTGLVFLGLVPLSGANWGVMLSLAYNRGAIYTTDAILNVLAPVGAIALLQLSLVWLARGLEEVFNPRLRTSV